MFGSRRPENPIARVATAFKECLADGEVLKSIDELFGDLDFEFDPEAEERSLAGGVGQRRSRAAGYLEALDLSESVDRGRLLLAIGTKLAEWSDTRGPSDNRLKRLHQTLKAAGYKWNGSEVVPRTPPPRPTPAKAVATPAPARVTPPEPTPDAPAVFISYAHEDKDVAQALADALRARGCRVWIDVENMRIGDDLADRIGKAIDSVDFLLGHHLGRVGQVRLVQAGVGDRLRRRHEDRSRQGAARPPGVCGAAADPQGPVLASSRSSQHRGDGRQDHGRHGRAPWRPRRWNAGAEAPGPAAFRPDGHPAECPDDSAKVDADEPIRIIGIDEAGVTRPRNDGTAGSGLYVVPLRLNRKPSPLWAHFFPAAWDHPSTYTTMHRPGIARVSGDRIILDGTTMEEVERYHAATLRLVIPEVNRQVAAQEEVERVERERADAESRAHDEAVREAAKRITFD